jgi:hypothetical protein
MALPWEPALGLEDMVDSAEAVSLTVRPLVNLVVLVDTLVVAVLAVLL